MNKVVNVVLRKEVSFVSDDLRAFGRMIKKLLNSNFSNLSYSQELRIEELEKRGKVFLTYPTNSFTGDKWLEIEGKEIRAEQWYKPWKEGDILKTLTSSGKYGSEYNPAPHEGYLDYWDDFNDYQLGHQLVELSHSLILRGPIFVAKSGYDSQDSRSHVCGFPTIKVKVAYDPDTLVYLGTAEIESPVEGYYWKAFNRAARELCID